MSSIGVRKVPSIVSPFDVSLATLSAVTCALNAEYDTDGAVGLRNKTETSNQLTTIAATAIQIQRLLRGRVVTSAGTNGGAVDGGALRRGAATAAMCAAAAGPVRRTPEVRSQALIARDCIEVNVMIAPSLLQRQLSLVHRGSGATDGVEPLVLCNALERTHSRLGG